MISADNITIMTRKIAETSNRLSATFLKEHGYLTQGACTKYGGVKWIQGKYENNMRFNVKIHDPKTESDKTDYIELIYTVTDNWTGEKHDMKYKVPLTTTPCNYGGRRYWFVCPLKKNGKYCGRRVGVIYGVEKWFACRHCANVAYRAQFQGGNYRMGSYGKADIDQALSEVTRKYYKNKLTRKYKRYLRMRESLDYAWAKMASKYGFK